jgi:hypothetical protein
LNRILYADDTALVADEECTWRSDNIADSAASAIYVIRVAIKGSRHFTEISILVFFSGMISC